MNLLSPPRNRLAIEVVFDLICPWCYLGTRRLQRALRARSDVTAAISWRPFLLNPDIPDAGIPRADYLVRKFGGEDRARRLHATIAEIGRAEDIPFRFDRIRRIPSSLDAHKLVRLAARMGVGDEAVEALFSSYFCDGADIGQFEVLLAIGRRLGLDTDAVVRSIASQAEATAVHADNLRAHRLGINGVPCFVIDGRQAIAGAQEAEVLDRLLDVAVSL